MKKVLLFILILTLQGWSSLAQDCYNSTGVTDKNSLEINFSNVEIKSEGQKSYLYFDINLKRLSNWYNTADKKLNSNASNLTSFDIKFDFNNSVMVGTLGGAVIECLEWGYFVNEAMEEEGGWNEVYVGNYWSGIQKVNQDLVIGSFSFGFNSGAGIGAYVYAIPTDAYVLMGKFRWPIQSGATGGNTGVAVRLNEDVYTDKFAYATEAYNSGNAPMNFCISGQVLDIPISDTPAEKPVLANISGDTKICRGVGKTYTTSFTAGGDGATVKWTVKKDGADVTANVVQGGAITSTTTLAAFTWVNDVPAGNYMISAIPSNAAGDGDEKLLAVEVFVPTVTIAGNSSGCAGEALTLTANPTTMQSYQWFSKNGANYTSISGATNATYNSTLPTTGSAITYKVEATATAAEGGCTASAEKTITINPLPTLAIETEIAGGKRPLNSTKYALGDKIVVTVLNGDQSTYDYLWLEGSNVKQGLDYTISAATTDTYTIKLTVSPKSGGGCPKDTTITLTRDGSLCAPTLALSGTGGNKICTGGVCLLKAEVTNLCSGNEVLQYEWCKGAEVLELQKDNGMEASYAVTAAGTYTVRLYTSFGMISKDIQVTTNATLAETLTIPASTMIGAGETTILSAQCNNVTQWTWKPKELISGSHEVQYVKTEPLTEDTDFTVYAEQVNGCMSSGKTKVQIGTNGLNVELKPALLALCNGGSGTLEAKVTGGTAPYQFIWPATNLESSKDNIAKYKHDGFTTDYTEYLTVTDASGNSVNVEVKVTVATANEPKLTLTGGELCQDDKLTVDVVGSVSDYTWYIKDNSDPDAVITTKPNQGAILKMADRGDYTVWVAGNVQNVCSSDTAKTKVNVKVNGFDLAWDPKPVDYKLGGVIDAGVRIDNATATSYDFKWDALKNGQQTTAAGANPNKYQVTAASESVYQFNVEASVKISDTKTCAKTLNESVSTKAGGLLLTLADKTVTQCNGGAVQISASAQGGTGAYTFTWYKAGDAATELRKQVYPVGGAATDVFVQGGFSNGDKVVVQVTDASSPVLTRRDTIVVNTSSVNAPIVDAGADMTIQSGTPTVLFGEVLSGSPKSWHWSPEEWLATGEGSKQYPTTKTLNAQQKYTLYVIGDNNCVSQPDQVIVNVTTTGGFTVDIEEPGVLCVGNTTKLSAKTTPEKTGITWEWFDPAGQLTNTGVQTPDFEASGTTTVYVKATVGGVTASNSKVVTVKSDKAPTLEIQGFLADKTAVCEGSELKVVATNTPAIVLSEAIWYVDGNKQSGNGLTFKAQLEDGVTSAIRQIKVEAKSTAGCPAIGAAEKNVTLYAQPELEWDASSTLVIAQGDAVEMTATLKAETKANYIYTWSHPDKVGAFGFSDGGQTASPSLSATSSVTGLAGGAQVGDVYCFQVFVTDGNSCQSALLEKDVIVDGNALIVELKPKYTDGYCEGGMAILQATVKAATQPTGLKYEWYKNDGPISATDADYILNGNELVVKVPNTTDTYKVKVTADGDKAGQSGGVTLIKNTTHTAVVLTGVDLLIPQGTHTALMATSPVTIDHWQWSPKEMLASGEDTLQNPYTINLTKKQIYTVYGVDENSCVTKPANVTVEVTSVTPPADGNKELFALIEPDKRVICTTNKLQLNTKVWGNPGGATSFSWEPSVHLDMTPGAEKPIFSVNQPGDYSYAVTVTRGVLKAMARTDISVINGTIPKLALDLSKTGLACAGSEVAVKVTNGVSVDKYTWIIDGVVNSEVTGNTYTWPSVDNPTMVNVKVIAETAGHCISENVIEMDSLVKPALKLDDLQVVDSCGQVILFSNAGKDAQYTWSLTAGDTQLQKVEGTSADTLYLKQKTNFTAASVPYTVAVKVKPQNGGCESTGNKTGKVYFQPKVVLDPWTYEGEALAYTVREKGENVPVSIDNDHSNFGVGNSTLDWMSYAGVSLTKGPEQAIVYNIQKEDTIVAIVTNKEAPGCVSRDSMPVYLYPDAPEVDIDTNTNRNTIKLTWKAIPADSVRVWGILDDAYNVGGNGYKRLASVKAINKQWIETNMGDRLKFYYLQSVRKIGDKSFASQVVSDTVGWLKQTLYGKNTIVEGKENVFAYPFDMTEKGIMTERDLVTKLIDPNLISGGGFMGFWDFTNQVWKSESFFDFGDGKLIWDATPFDLIAGSTYNLAFDGALKDKGDLLLFGRLTPLVYNFILNTGDNASENYVLYPLSLCNKKSLQSLGFLLKTTYLGPYNYSNQIYDSMSGADFGGGVIWEIDETDPNSPIIKPWTPIRFTVLQTILNWRK